MTHESGGQQEGSEDTMARPVTPPRQASLFNDNGSTADSAVLVTVTASRASLTRTQRTFNRLTYKIRRQRDELAEWEAYTLRFEQRARSELDPVERDVRDHRRRLVRRLDALLTAPEPGDWLSKRHRALAQSQIIALIDAALAAGPPRARRKKKPARNMKRARKSRR